MRLLKLAMHHAGAALAEHRTLRLWRRCTAKTCKLSRHVVDDAPVIDGAGGGHYHIGPAIMRGEIAAQHVAIELLQRLGGSQQRTAHRLIGIAELVEVLEHDVVGVSCAAPISWAITLFSRSSSSGTNDGLV